MRSGMSTAGMQSQGLTLDIDEKEILVGVNIGIMWNSVNNSKKAIV